MQSFVVLVVLYSLCLPLRAHAFPPAPVPPTGQVRCYDASGTEIECAGTGQDADVQSVAVSPTPRFTDRNDGTVKDNVTGLIWLKNGNCFYNQTWPQALNLANGLADGSCGLTDGSSPGQWRLPAINELRSLLDYGNHSFALPTGHPFTGVQSYYYWSSSSYVSSSKYAWYVDLRNGFVDSRDKSYSGYSYLWPVRNDLPATSAPAPVPRTGQSSCWDVNGDAISCSNTGQDGDRLPGVPWPDPRFSDNNDGTVTDNLTGLTWLKDLSCFAPKAWTEALATASSLASGACGLGDDSSAGQWHLPNLNELSSLVTAMRSAPSLPAPHPFKGVIPTEYWSSTSDAYNKFYAWGVFFNDGRVVNSNKSLNAMNFWPVRSGQYWADSVSVFLQAKFGRVFTGTEPSPHEILIRNRRGTGPITAAVSLSGPNAAEFGVGAGGKNPCTTVAPTVAPGESCTLLLSFRPQGSGAKSAVLRFTENGTVRDIPVSATAVSSIYGTVTDQATGDPVSGATLTLDATRVTTSRADGSFDFGELPSATYVLSAAMAGHQPVAIRGLEVTGTASARSDILLPTVGLLNITSTTLPWGSPDTSYRATIRVTGGTAPYTFTLYDPIPAGLSFHPATGTIWGSPKATGSFVMTVGVTDSVAGYAEKELTLDLVTPLMVASPEVVSGQQGVQLEAAILATGGIPSYSFAVSAGRLPVGLALGTDGRLAGTAREAGDFPFTVLVTDSTGRRAAKAIKLALAAAPALALGTTSLPDGYKGRDYAVTLSTSGGVSPRTFALTGVLPAGLSFNATNGTIIGIPIASGLTNLTVTVSDDSYPTPQIASQDLTLRVWRPVDGSCGSANGTAVASQPTSALCGDGSLPTVYGTGPWTWTCAGSHTGSAVHCLALQQGPSISALSPRDGAADVPVMATISAIFSEEMDPRTLTKGSVTLAQQIGIKAVAAGHDHMVALRNDGTVLAWGNNRTGETTVPAGLSDVVAVAAGEGYSLALRADGTAVSWGNGYDGLTAIPAGISGVAAVDAGPGHVVAVKMDGTVVAWGQNSSGQTSVPTGLSDVVKVAAGSGFSLALRRDGTVVSWGRWGGSIHFQPAYVPYDLADVKDIAAGSYHAMALKRDGTVVAWGALNDSGQATVPAGLSGVVAIAARNAHNIALKADGTVVAWGSNYFGESAAPTGLSGVVAVDAGNFSSVALKSDGSIVAWGENGCGQCTVPTQLSGVTALAAGNRHSIALRGDGTVRSWGCQSTLSRAESAIPSGIVAIATGDSDSGAPHTLAVRSDGTVISWGDDAFGQATLPNGLRDVTAVAAGAAHSLALNIDGTVVAWGDNTLGQTTIPEGLSEVAGIAAGRYHTIALKRDGTVVGWGDNSSGQATPPAGLAGIAAVAAGKAHTLALKSDGSVTAWGDNSFGQSAVPYGLTGVTAISAGGNHSLALKHDGTVVAWGANDSGQCSVPAGISEVIAIAAGGRHSLALRRDGTVVAWGDNSSGQGVLPSIPYLRLIPSEVTYHPDSRAFVLTPAETLPSEARLTATVTSGVRSALNVQPARDTSWSFITEKVPPQDGVCGISQGAFFTEAPAIGLCSAGKASTMTGSGPWNWTCAGQYGGIDTRCFAAAGNPLTVIFGGTGGGSVQGDMVCASGAPCATKAFAIGATASLLALPDSMSTFISWGGACTGKSDCTVVLDAAKSVIATFAKAPKAMVGGVGYASLSAAYAAAPSVATVVAIDSQMPDGGIVLDKGKTIALKGGYRADYSARTGLPTVLKGQLRIVNGVLRVDSVVIR